MNTESQRTRVRYLKDWTLLSIQDEFGRYAAVAGIVMTGSHEDPQELHAIRFTKSSEIVHVDGKVLTTKSGSEYHLIGRPAKEYLIYLATQGISFDSENPVPKELISRSF